MEVECCCLCVRPLERCQCDAQIASSRGELPVRKDSNQRRVPLADVFE